MKILFKICHFIQYNIADNCPPYIPICPGRYIINTQKGLTLPWVLFLICFYSNVSISLWVYAGLHGSYGIVWIIKDSIAADPRFNQKLSLGSCIVYVLALAGYWVIPWTIAAGYGIQNPSPERIMISILMYAIGVVLMMTADIQKYFVLKIKKGLISDGLFTRTRNPNYLGEMILYASFGVLSGFPPNFIPLGIMWTLFMVFMINKEESYMRKEGWNEYKKRSLMLLPRLCGPYLLNYAIYGLIASLVYGLYLNGGITAIIARFSILFYR